MLYYINGKRKSRKYQRLKSKGKKMLNHYKMQLQAERKQAREKAIKTAFIVASHTIIFIIGAMAGFTLANILK